MNVMKKIPITGLLIFGALSLFAQQEMTLHLMRELWQANRTNPAILPANKITIGLPNIYNRLHITGATYDDLVGENANGESTLTVDLAIAELEDDNDLRESLQLETLSLGLRLGNWHASVYHALKFDAYLNYPKTLPQLIWQGNAQFIGQDVAIDHDVQIFGYNEIGLGLGVELSPKFTLGGRAKLLSGVGDASTERTQLSVYTDEETYQLAMTADYLLNSTSFVRYNNFRDLELDFDLGEFGMENFFSENFGMAFDIGARFRTEKWDIAASAIDLGNITWRDEARNYAINGIYEYTGLDVAKAFLEDSITLNNALDTLEQIFQIDETSNEYSTRLPAKFYLSVAYQLNPKLRLGGAVFSEFYRDRNFPGVALSAQYQLSPTFSLGGSYTISAETYNNLGLNGILNLGPFQLFAVTDNIPAVFRPGNSHHFSARVGLNLIFFAKTTDEED